MLQDHKGWRQYRASDAVGAAVDIQRALAAHAWPQDVFVRVRIGLHTGEPQRSPEGYVGLDVHHAARIMSADHGGQILLSQATSALVEQSLPDGVQLQDLGEHRLKDLRRPSRLFQLLVAGFASTFPSLKTLDSHPNNLPIKPTPFIGREREVAALTRLLARPEVRLVTLTGPGGMGKTRLALQVAAEVSDEYSDGVFMVPLAPMTEAEQVIEAIAQVLEIADISGLTLLSQVQRVLKSKKLLLVLDNFEQVTAAALLVAELLASCPALKILVTSRVALHVRAEREFTVPPLSVPNPKRLPDLATLSQYEAVALFIERAQAVKSDFQVSNATALRSRVYVYAWMGCQALLEEFIAINQALGDTSREAWATFLLACLLFVSQRDPERAQRLAEQSLAQFEEQNIGWMRAFALGLLGQMHLVRGEWTQARVKLEESVVFQQETGPRGDSIGPLLYLARVALAQQELVEARRRCQENLRLQLAIGSQMLVPSCLEVMGMLLAAQDMVLEAVELWGAAEALREVLGAVMHPIERDEYEQTVTAARLKVGEEAFARAWNRGGLRQ